MDLKENERKLPAPEPSKTLYEKPKVVTETLTAVAAVCNGSTHGGRKATTPACNANRLKS